MEALSFLDTIFNDWKLLAFAFAVGGLYYQAKLWFRKITDALDNTANTHNLQNKLLDNINDKLDNLDRRTAKIEGSIELIQHENNQQAIKLAVLETQAEIIDHPVKRRPRRQQS
jgi:hypothetical protein